MEIWPPRMNPRFLWSKLSALKSSMECFYALGPIETFSARLSNPTKTAGLTWVMRYLPGWPLELARPSGNLSVFDSSMSRTLS